MALTKLSQITSGGVLNPATDTVVIVRNGTTDLLAAVTTLLTSSTALILSFRAITGATTSDTAGAADVTISWQSSAATKTQNIPAAAAGNKGQVYNICDGNGTAAVGNPINITPASGTVNGGSVLAITAARGAWQIQSDGRFKAMV